MRPSGIHHVALCVPDAERGLAFYRDVLGMTQLPRPDFGPGYWLDAGGQQLHLMEMDGEPHRANHFALRVDDVDCRGRRSAGAGRTRRRGPVHRRRGPPAFLHDPFGNFIELNQPD